MAEIGRDLGPSRKRGPRGGPARRRSKRRML